MGNVKWAVICARQALDHLDGSRPSHELASLGRRICEPEWDLLDQLAQTDWSAGLMQDFPKPEELLDAVAAYLFAELRPQVPKEERFRVLVAANVCAVVAREIRAGTEPDLADVADFRRAIGVEALAPSAEEAPAEAREAAAELAALLREGRLDDTLAEAIPILREVAARKLEIARPGYADPG